MDKHIRDHVGKHHRHCHSEASQCAFEDAYAGCQPGHNSEREHMVRAGHYMYRPQYIMPIDPYQQFMRQQQQWNYQYQNQQPWNYQNQQPWNYQYQNQQPWNYQNQQPWNYQYQQQRPGNYAYQPQPWDYQYQNQQPWNYQYQNQQPWNYQYQTQRPGNYPYQQQPWDNRYNIDPGMVYNPRFNGDPNMVYRPNFNGDPGIYAGQQNRPWQYMSNTLRSMVGHSVNEYDRRVPADLGCARFVSAAVERAYGMPVRDASVEGLERSLQRQGFQAIPAQYARAGDVIIGHRYPGQHGHAAIYAGNGQVVDNSSSRRQIVVSKATKFNSPEFQSVVAYRLNA